MPLVHSLKNFEFQLIVHKQICKEPTLFVFHLSWWNYILMMSPARGKLLFEADAFGLGLKMFAPSAYLHCIFLRELDQCLRHTCCGCLLFRLSNASYKGTNLRNLLAFSFVRRKCHVLQIIWILGYLKMLSISIKNCALTKHKTDMYM